MTVVVKVALLLIHLVVLFLLARLIDTIVWVGNGLKSGGPLDPRSLSVRQLTALLEQRGVIYEGVMEKPGLIELMEASGFTYGQEMEEAMVQTDFPLTNFTSDFEYREQVEESKDSMWLVEIVSDPRMTLSDTSWTAIRRKLGKFGIMFGQYNCTLDVGRCKRRKWLNSRLMLTLPANLHSSADIQMHTYSGQITTKSLFKWVKRKLDDAIKPIGNIKTFQDSWLTFDSPLSPEIRIVFMSYMTSVPCFLSAVGAKFQERVVIGAVDTGTTKGRQMVKESGIKSTPAYVVLTPEGKYSYGAMNGESLTFRAVQTFVISYYPTLSDIVSVSIICTNMVAIFEIALRNGIFRERLGKLLLCMLKYNGIILLIWAGVVKMLRFPSVGHFGLNALKCLRLCASTTLFPYIRQDVVYYMSNIPLLLTVTTGMLFAVGYIKTTYFPGYLYDEQTNNHTIDTEDNAGVNVNTGTVVESEARQPDLEMSDDEQIPVSGVPGVGLNEAENNAYNHSNDSVNRLVIRLNGNNEQNELWRLILQNAGYRVIEVNRNNSSKEYVKHLPCWYFREETGSGDASVSQDTEEDDATEDNSERDRFKEIVRTYAVDSLNIIGYKPDGYIEDSMCLICQENYRHHVLLRGLPCRHVFHAECVGAWLIRENDACPSCRWPANEQRV